MYPLKPPCESLELLIPHFEKQVETAGSQDVVTGPAASASQELTRKANAEAPTPDLLNQKL